jgi:hypothetical protein
MKGPLFNGEGGLGDGKDAADREEALPGGSVFF